MHIVVHNIITAVPCIEYRLLLPTSLRPPTMSPESKSYPVAVYCGSLSGTQPAYVNAAICS
ncbi:hypothetical protein CPB85DRAFT_1302085 [Mucidula mucida]|nr:hypothetical protein CPB85DRAFT_1302085 [Mucidula mucida]